MVIADEDAAISQLLAIGYYRLSGYCYTFREHAVPCASSCDCPRRSDIFVPGPTLERVVELYEFDRMLRLLVLDGIERVEVALRMRLGYIVGAGGAFAHLDPAGWMQNLTYIRNICAHHGRLWNRNIAVQLGRLGDTAELVHASAPRSKSRVYASLAVLAFLTTQISPRSTWRTRVIDLMSGQFAGLGLPVEQMGFPFGWENETIWSAGYRASADPIPPEHRQILRHFEWASTAEAGKLLDTSNVAKRRTSAVRSLRSPTRSTCW
ncbi:Abi family protein [Nocardia caishijiensis]|nr:Abi family protein [Nocardia caishijiensis]